MTAAAAETYRVHLPQFEGPFDLLLFFIERDELDIYDIPISRITEDFLSYLQQMQRLNIELASEFILVAGTLMRIKARLLIPRPELDEQGKEIDPREELVQRLLEYKRYKSVLEEIVSMEATQAARALRGNIQQEEKQLASQAAEGDDLYGIDLYALMRTFKRIWERHHEKLQKPQHVIQKYPYTTEEVKEIILDRVGHAGRQDFVSLVLERGERIYVVFCFLAILELVQMQRVRIRIGQGFNNFWIEAKPEAEESPAIAEGEDHPEE